MIEMGKKYQTRDGRAVRILATDVKDPGWPIVGIIARFDGTEYPGSWTAIGSYTGDSRATNADLVPVPTKHEGFIVVGKDGFVWGQNVVSTIGEVIEAGFKKEEGDHIVRIAWED